MARVTKIIHEDAAWIGTCLQESLGTLEGSTILLTGSAGFLGAYLLDVLADWNERASTPARILALDNNLVGLPERVAHLQNRPDIHFVTHDMRKPYEPGEPVHFILHLAGVASPMFYRKYPLETIDVNVNGTRHLLELCRHHPVKAMLHLSTSEIYGDPSPDAIPTREDYRGFVSCTGPRACYDESKRLSETLCTIYHQQFGIPIKVGRPFNVYGPGQRIDDRRIIPDLMQAVVQNEPIVLLSDGKATRSFCYLRDACCAMLLILLKGKAGEAYNLGNDGEEVTMRQAAETLIGATAYPHPLQFRTSEDPHYLTDNPQRRRPDLTKIRTLGYEPRVTLREGLVRTLSSYREDQA